MSDAIEKLYGNRVRQRVCGLCWEGDKLLLVNHSGLIPGGLWAPPGGGIEFGQSLTDTLEREFKEETGLLVNTGGFLFGCEFINPPLHALELYFEAHVRGGKLVIGKDPELNIITDVRFMELAEIRALPENNVHGLFRHLKNREELSKLKGFLKL